MELPINTEVELAPGYDHLYNPDPFGNPVGAFVGARAHIRDRKDDEVGFPQVFIEWKKDDWRYAGMPDGWTFENHFRPIVEVMKQKSNTDLLSEMLQKAQESRNVCEHCGEDHEAEIMGDYLDEFREASEEILGGDGFFIMSVKKIPDGQGGESLVFDGKIFDASMSEEAREAIEQQLIQVAAQLTLNRRRI